MKSLRTSSINRLREKAAEAPKPRIKWQSYLLASVMVFGFLIFTQQVWAESNDTVEPTTATESISDEEPVKVEKNVNLLEVASTLDVKEPPQPEEATIEEPTPEPVAEPEPEVSAAPEPAAEEAPAENVSPEEAAQHVVSEFYLELALGHMGTAYDKLSPDFQETLPYSVFQEGYEGTEGLTCQLKHSELLDDGRVRLDIQLGVEENGVPTEYYVTCLVESHESEWLLDGVVQLRG